jgi:hypothetical protein
LYESSSAEIYENWSYKLIAPHDIARFYVSMHDLQCMNLFQSLLEILFVLDRMVERSAHFHGEFNASASEDQIESKDFLGFWPNFKCRKHFQKKPFSQTRNEKLFFVICEVVTGKRFARFNALDGSLLILVFNQVNISKGSERVEGGTTVKRALLIFGKG